MQSVAPIVKQTCCAGFLSLSVLSFPSPSLAVTVEEVPNPRQVNGGWVTDMANVLSPSTETQLNRLITELEAKNGSEIAVVTVPETAPAKTPKEFTTALFKHWKIGKADRDNGVLFLISKGDRRVEIETGYGVEKILPDARVGNIIQQEVTPRLKQGDYNGGTLVGTKALVTALEGKAHNSNALTPTPSANTQTTSTKELRDSSAQPGWFFGVLALVGLGMLSGLAMLVGRGSRNDDDGSNGGSRGCSRRHRRSANTSSMSTTSTSTGSTSTGSTSTGSTSTGSTSTGGGSFGGGSSGGGGAGGSY